MCKILLLKVKFAAKVQKNFQWCKYFYNKKIVKSIFFVKITLLQSKTA